MAQDLQIGKAGLAATAGGDGLVLHCSGWEQTGDEVRLSGVLRGHDQSALREVKALRDQLQGYHLNVDEPIIPVRWAQDVSRSGFYRVQSIEVSSEITGRMSASADNDAVAYSFKANLLAVENCPQPLFEIVSAGAVRSNGHGATGDPWVGFPIGATSSSYQLGDVSSLTAADLTTDTGSQKVKVVASGSGLDYLYDGWLSYTADAAGFYYGAAGFEVSQDSGSTWQTLVGRQMPVPDSGTPATNWRMTNHLTRVSIASGDLRVERYDSSGGTWEATDFQVGTNSGTGSATFTAVSSWDTASVLLNSPECCAVRLNSATGGTSAMTVDLTLRRGSTLIEGRATSILSTNHMSVYRDASEAGTAITGGIEATAANASGNKYIILSPQAITKDVTGTSGIDTTAAATYIDFGIGVSNDDLISGQVTAIEEYFAANRVRQRIVVR